MRTQVNEIKISYQGGIKAGAWKKITTSQDAAQLLYDHWDKDTIEVQEFFKVVLMNNSNKVKGIYQISQGSITGYFGRPADPVRRHTQISIRVDDFRP